MDKSTLSPTAASSLAEWLSYLENSHFKAIDLGLARVQSVAQQLDLLTPAPFVITVGGTNGKGTTCRLLEILLLNAGYRVGVYSSPHLLRYNERVRIQNQELPDSAHCESFVFIDAHRSASLTYFEFSTLSALHLFKQAKLDVVILEVGLGGRLDATNIVDSDIAVITGIDIDHTEFLGNTREQIGFEKAGIFRANKPVVIGDPQIPDSMLQQANKLHCHIMRRDMEWLYQSESTHWTWQGNKQGQKVRLENLPFPRIPLANAATALAVVQHLPFDISAQVIMQSLQQVELNGRFQFIAPEKLTVLAASVGKTTKTLAKMVIDVGHNPQAARYLAEKLTALRPQIQGKIIAVCGILKDKDTQGVLSPLLPFVDYWYCATLEGSRGQAGEALLYALQQVAQTHLQSVSAEAQTSVAEAVKSAVKNSEKSDLILVFGSFYTVAGLLECLTIHN
ncbi:bifunctional tetrahydrofolate synthase/dihydrofolate synthase [Actinobacillus seminis]|uniref:Dihydrofolate synthase/folylpolyglutamate synthase n=1 Tax=Actinobacillus seminis TaxID=722 RepID=A0A263HBV2_9PAST|nr:bifunctional tetrahydrofolate synthase/dihydrofolate synthase [Actinobacillus seminis]OZN24943.1 bifunctional tetrahydrofolate synthase/dihydrofolate synthase [Actinobacillus seminis]SUU36447.1 bifunctional folylpolyglutamate synthase/ dihydrofolate synthase [Actinobacillus seminis]